MRIRNWLFTFGVVLALAAPTMGQSVDLNKNPKIIERGRGWNLLEIWAEGEDPNLPGHQVWMVTKKGVQQLPVSSFVRDGIRASFSEDETEVLYHHRELWELIEEGPEQATRRYPEAVEAMESGCPDQTRHKTGNVDESIDVGPRTFSLFNGVSGTLTVDIPIGFNGAYDLTYLKKRSGFWGICFTTGFKFVSVQANGDANLAGSSDASAQVQITGHWEKEWSIANPKVVDTWFWVGPVPVNLEVFVPVNAGLEIDATLTGDMQLNSLFGASGSFDYLCTTDGCSGTSDFQDNFDFNDIDMGLELEVEARALGRVGLHAQIYSSSFAYGYAGVEGYLTGDFWGYYGSTCGDADGDGNNETVSGAAVELGWGWDIKYEYGGLLIPDGDGTVPGDTGDLGWWDLLGPSSALQPMLLGPAQVETGNNVTYHVQMRPCYPYSDRVNFSLLPSGWTGNTSVVPPNQVTVHRTFNENPGDLTLTVTNNVDNAGREIYSDYQRTIEILEACSGNTNLSVSLTEPDEGDEITDSLFFSANASDDFGVTKVQFRIDGSVVCLDTTEPWSCTVDVSGYPEGQYTLTGKAFGVCGNTTISTPVNVTLNPEPLPPSIPVHVAAVAIDPNGTLVGEVTSTPGDLHCSSDGNPDDCDELFGDGQTVTLEAVITDDPIGRGDFQKWIGPNCPFSGSTNPNQTFTVTGEITCTAQFKCFGTVPQCIGEG